MNSFGLGLVLSFTDKASVGIMGAVGTFKELSNVVDGSKGLLESLGSTMVSLGTTMTAATAPLLGALKTMWSEGLQEASFVENINIALETFLGSAEAATEHLGRITRFSYETPFDYASLLQASQSLLKMGQSSEQTEKTLRMLGDAAGAMGQQFGFVDKVIDVMGKIQAEGKASTTRIQQLARAGVDMTGIVKDMTSPEIWGQMEKNFAKYGGMMDKMLNTWSGAVDEFKSKLALAGNELLGVYYDYDKEQGKFVKNMEGLERLTQALRKVSTFIENTASALAPLGQTILWVVESLADALEWLGNMYADASEEQQGFVGTLVQVAVFGGPALMLLGKLLPIIGGLALKFAPLAGAAAIFFALWHNNIGGFKDSATTAFDKVIGLFKILWEYFTTGGLSQENFDLMYALGIDALVEGIIMTKNRLTDLWQGIQDGFVAAIEGVYDFLKSIGLFQGEFDFFKDFGEWLRDIASPENAEKWRKLGEVIGKVVFAIAGLLILNKVTSLFSGLGKVVGGIFGMIGKIGGKGGTAAAGGAGGFGLADILNPKTALKAMGSIAIIIGGFGLIVAAWGLLSKIDGFQDFMKSGAQALAKFILDLAPAALALGVLAIFMGLVAKLGKPESIVKGMEAMANVIAGFTLIVLAFGLLDEMAGLGGVVDTGVQILVSFVKDMTPIMPQLLIATALVALLSKGMDELDIDADAVLEGMKAIAIVIGGFGLIVTAFGTLEEITGFSRFLESGAVILSKIQAAMESLVTPEMGVLFAAIGGISYGLEKLKMGPEAIMKGMIVVAEVIGGFGLIATAFGALEEITGFSKFLDSGAEILIKVAGHIGEFVGSIISGFGVGITNGLPKIGENLAGFAENVKPFFDMLGQTDFSGMGQFLDALVSFTLGMTQNNVLSFFTDWFTGGTDLRELGRQLVIFGESAQPFFEAMGEVDGDAIDKSVQVMDALASIGNMDFKTGGMWQAIIGETSLDVIGNQLVSFAPNGKEFFAAVAEYSQDGLDKAPSVFKAIEGIGNMDFKQGGAWQLLIGETSLDEIGKQLVSFAPNGDTFFKAVAEYSQDGLDKAPDVFKALEGIGNMDFKKGGAWQLLIGTTSLDDIGKQLVAFAPAGSKFFTTVMYYPQEGLDRAPQLFDILAGISKVKFEMGGLKAFFTGDTRLDLLGQQLGAFAEPAKIFFTAMGEIDKSGFEHGTLAIAALAAASMIDARSGGIQGTILNIFAGENDFAKMGENLVKFGTSSKKYWETMAGMDKAGFEGGLEAIKVASLLGGIEFRDNGFLQAIFGEINLKDLGEQLKEFAPSAFTFFSYAKNFTNEALEQGKKMIEVLATFGDTAYRSGGFLQALMGEVDLKVIGDNLAGFTDGAKTFFKMVARLEPDVFPKAIDLFDSLSTMNKLVDISLKLTGGEKEGVLAMLGQDLSDFMVNSETFFEMVNGTSVEGLLEFTPALDDLLWNVLSGFKSKVLSELATGLDELGVAIESFMTKMEGVPIDLLGVIADNIIENKGVVLDAVITLCDEADEILTGFAENGAWYGETLINTMAQGIIDSSSVLGDALTSTINGSIPDIDLSATGTPFASGASGGEITSGGMMMVHPNELLVDSPVKQQLEKFLNRQSADQIQAPQTGGDDYDNRVYFQAGSIQFIVDKDTSREDVTKHAETLMKEIERLQQKRQMAQRNTKLSPVGV